jgi:hypothetical protein
MMERRLRSSTVSHQLNLQIPDNLYQPLAQVAGRRGQTPEELILNYLTQVVQDQVTDDPIEEFIGAFNSTVPDWLDRHDDYNASSISSSPSPQPLSQAWEKG